MRLCNNWFVNSLPEIVLNIKNSNWNYQFDHFSTTVARKTSDSVKTRNSIRNTDIFSRPASMTAAQSPAQPPFMHRRNSHLDPRSSKPAYIRLHETSPSRDCNSTPDTFGPRLWLSPPSLSQFLSSISVSQPHPLRRHNSATIVRIQSNFQLETRIFADRRPKVYRSHWSRCFLLIESSYVTCARVHGLIKPRVHSACIWQTFQLDFWRPEQVENRRLFVRERSCFRSMTRRWF